MKTMLEYQKTILSKVSFDKNIFKKELQKSIRWLKLDELYNLFEWALSNFGPTHGDVIRQVVPSDRMLPAPGSSNKNKDQRSS